MFTVIKRLKLEEMSTENKDSVKKRPLGQNIPWDKTSSRTNCQSDNTIVRGTFCMRNLTDKINGCLAPFYIRQHTDRTASNSPLD